MPSQTHPIALSSGIPPQSLWHKALETLDEELWTSLDFNAATHCDIPSAALKVAQEKKQVCVQKRWTLKKRNGELIILRDVVEKIIVWVEKFIAVGDAAVQYDPGHAAPAWAAFRFVLQMAVNDKKVFGEMLENLETISHLITRYAMFEELYLQRNSGPRAELETKVISLYAEVLTFLAKARKYFQTSTRIRVATSILKFSEDEQMAKIMILESQVSKLAELVSAEIQRDTEKSVAAMSGLLASLDKPIKRLIDQSTISAQVLQNSKHLELLRWLSPVPFSSHHKRHSKSRIPGSGKWLLNHPQYLTWRNTSSSSILLLHGILGSGKTSLTSAVVDSFLQEVSGQVPPTPIAYFYCTKNQAEAERTDPGEIMRSILRQLTVDHGSVPKVHDRILREYERREAEAKTDGFDMPKLQVHECVRLILDTTGANPATIVVDAVDEIQANCRHELLCALTQITKESASVVKVFVTSRDDSNVHALLPDALTVRIQSQSNREDIELFVHHEVSLSIQHHRMLNGNVSDDLRESLTQKLIAGSGEMFIWAVRQIENLSRMKLEADVRNAMQKLPKETLNDLYEDIFNHISKAEPQAFTLAMQTFSLLLCTQEPLSPKAFLQAIATTAPHHHEAMDLSRMMDICFNLIVLDPELNVLRFTHVSFQEFLEMRAEFAPHCAHRVAAVSCLELCLQGFPIGMEARLAPKDNFYHYSAVYWAKHCGATDVGKRDDAIIGKLEEFVFDEGDIALPFLSWLEELPKFSKQLANEHPLTKDLHAVIHSGGSPLFTACVFGLSSLVDTLALTSGSDWNQKNDLGQTGLYLAAAAGHETIVQKLLQYAPDVNPLGGKFNHPLHAACFAGYVPIVELLLDHGADPKLGPKDALECSVLGGHENITLMLLEKKIEISDQADYDSILRQAAEAGFTEVVRFLQNLYAFSFGDLGSPKCRAIETAIFKGRTGVVERQIRKAAYPTTDLPSDAVAIAALGGQDAIVKLLIDSGLDIEREGPFGTPLRAASIMCHESTVRLLLKLGARLDVSGSLGDPLQAAAMRGHESITKMLLNEGANVNRHGGFYGTALQAAAHRGHQRIVEILLNAGADVHQGGFSRDSFHAAAEGGHENIVRLFLERGFKVQYKLPGVQYRKAPESPYNNLLREASPVRVKDSRCASGSQPKPEGWRERASTLDFHYILESIRGNNTPEHEAIQPYEEQYQHRSRDEDNYALQAAAASGHYSVVELLLAHVHTMDISNSQILTAFKEACKNGHQKVVKLLLTCHVEVEDLKAALKAAALHGHLAVVNILLDYGENLGLAGNHAACISCQNRQDQFPLIGADPNSSSQETFECNESVQLMWMAGCEGGKMPIVKRAQELAAQHCTATTMRHLYGDALHCAATHHNFDVVKALLDSGTDFDLKELSQTVDAICDWGNAPALQLLLKYDAQKLLGPQQYSRGVDKAARKGKHEVVHFLLRQSLEHHGLTINAETVIHVSGNGLMTILRPLIEHIRTEDSFPSTLNQSLQIASRNGHKEVVDFLIREGADVNAVVEEVQCTSGDNHFDAYSMSHHRREGSRKGTALQAALLGFRRFHPKSRHDYSPFDCVSWQRADASSQEQTIQLLLTNGANANEVAGHERYPLHMAASYCSAEIVQLLIATGANVNASTQQHSTAIQAAACREVGAVPVIKALLEAGEAFPQNDDGVKAALNEALSFFGDRDGKFQISNSLTDLLTNGPGAVVKILLDRLPEERADDSRYSLLFQMACMAGDRQCVELLLQRRIDVSRSGYYYGTGLQAASRVGNMDVIKSLLNARADVNILEGAHGTALRAAVLGGHEHVVGFLILHGADINLCYKNRGQSVLHLALEVGNRAIYKTLLAAGADEDKDMPNQQPIMISASKFGDATLVELLLASGADVNIPGKAPSHDASVPYHEASPLHAACAAGHESVAQFLLAHGADTEKIVQSSGTPLQAAIRGNHLSVVRLLLDAGVNVDHGSYHTPLSEASQDGKLEMVEELLKAGACIGDPPTVSNALAMACKGRQPAVFRLLLEALSGTEKEAPICADALSAAMQSRDDEMVRLLLEHGLTSTVETLHQACAAGLEETVRMMLVNGIDVSSDDGAGATPLHVAACHSYPAVVQLLIDRGADVDLRSTKYGSPLTAALEGCLAPFLRAPSQPEPCRSLAKALPLPGPEYEVYNICGGMESQARPGYKEVSQCEQIVQSLFDHGAVVDTDIRSFGNTLHLASCMGSETIVRHVLKRISDVNVFGGYFGSPLLAALEGDHSVIVELLLSHGIDVNHPSSEHGTALRYACAHGMKKSVQMLLDHGADVNACDEKHGSPLAAAVSAGNDIFLPNNTRSSAESRAIVELLLRYGDKVQVRECDLLAAAFCWSSEDGEYYIRLLLEHDQSVRATEPVIIQAIVHFNRYSSYRGTLPRLLERDGGLGTTPAMLKVAEKLEVMRMLLEHKPVCELTAEILEAASKRRASNFELVKLLLAHDPNIPIIEAAVMAVLGRGYSRASDGNLLGLLFDYNSEIEVTEAMLKGAKKIPDMKLLLKHRRKELPISSEVLEAVATCSHEVVARIRLLFEHDKSIKITPPVVQRAIAYYDDSGSLIETLLEHDPTLEIGQEQLLSMIKGPELKEHKRQTVELLVKHGKTLDFTPEISEALDEKYQSHSDKDLKECFYKLRRKYTS